METSWRNQGTPPGGGDISARKRRMSKPRAMQTEEIAWNARVLVWSPEGQQGGCWAGPGSACVTRGGGRVARTTVGGGQTHMVPVLLQMPSGWFLLSEGWKCDGCQVLTHLPRLCSLTFQVMTSLSCSKEVVIAGLKCHCG